MFASSSLPTTQVRILVALTNFRELIQQIADILEFYYLYKTNFTIR